MQQRISGRLRLLASVTILALALLMALPMTALASSKMEEPEHHARSFYQQTNLVSDLPNTATITDPNLINPWGLVSSPTSPWWISDNNAGVSTLYQGTGQIVPLVVTIPLPAGSPAGTLAAPTGTVFNGTNGFVVSSQGHSGPSLFIFATEDGTISGWNPTVDRTHAILTVDRSTVGLGAVYKGLTIGSNASGTFIYATNFRFGRVEMFDSNFHLTRSFTDPFLPRGYAPFGIQNIGGKLYVTFALQNAAKHDDIGGDDHGFVDVFNTDGRLLRRLVSREHLDSPWGLALAPANFGAFSNDLLVGNFRDGHINVFSPRSGEFLGQLESSPRMPIVIDHLWALEFGNGAAAGSTNSLFFTAGIDNEAHGLFGDIQSKS